jgi:hypothetical protein
MGADLVGKLLLRHTARIAYFGNAIFGRLGEWVSKIFSLCDLVGKPLLRDIDRMASFGAAIFGSLRHIAILAQFMAVFLCLKALCVHLQ